MYPALVNCSTIDWFGDWPQEALMEVAEKYLSNIDLNLGADTELLKVRAQGTVKWPNRISCSLYCVPRK